MKSIFISLTLTALATTAIAGTGHDVQSKPFRLLLHSGNATIDSTVLGACHAGAATKALCLSYKKLTDPAYPGVTFYHNVSSTPNAIDTDGVLTFNLDAGNFVASLPMEIKPLLTSNIGVPIFFPSSTAFSLLSFDQDGAMYMGTTENDMVIPPSGRNKVLKVENWYTCLTRYTYTYETLAWKIGLTGEPQNPSCEKVEVERVFVGEEAQAIAKMKMKGQH